MAHTRHARTVRAVPIWLLGQYLVEAGGVRLDPDPTEWRVAGEGWTARLTQVEDYEIGSLSVGQVRLRIEGEAKAVEDLLAALSPRLLRAGG